MKQLWGEAPQTTKSKAKDKLVVQGGSLETKSRWEIYAERLKQIWANSDTPKEKRWI